MFAQIRAGLNATKSKFWKWNANTRLSGASDDWWKTKLDTYLTLSHSVILFTRTVYFSFRCFSCSTLFSIVFSAWQEHLKNSSTHWIIHSHKQDSYLHRSLQHILVSRSVGKAVLYLDLCVYITVFQKHIHAFCSFLLFQLGTTNASLFFHFLSIVFPYGLKSFEPGLYWIETSCIPCRLAYRG